MPLYEYACPTCLTKYLCRRSIDNRNVPFLCEHCGEACRRRMAVPEILVRGNRFVGEGSGKYGKKKRAEKARKRREANEQIPHS